MALALYLLGIITIIPILISAKASPFSLSGIIAEATGDLADSITSKGTVTDDNVMNKVDFLLFTRDNNVAEKLKPGVMNKNLKKNMNRPIKIFIHGFLDHSWRPATVNMRKKFLETMDVVVINVNWWKGSLNPFYPSVRNSAEPVGRYVAKLVDWLRSEGADSKNIHIIGHSVGAHIAGFAGASLTPRIARITGLDPALPGFKLASCDNHLDPTDAEFVDVIHTSDGLYGYPGPLGHADFYMNGGKARQPGCLPVVEFGVCSHMRSIDYFTSSIDPKNRFEAAACTEIPSNGTSACTKSGYLMGNYLDTSARGLFYVGTTPSSPFALKIIK